MTKILCHTFIGLLTLGISGCVNSSQSDKPSAWPEKVMSFDENRFVGVYENQGATDPESDQSEHSNQLFDYLANDGQFKGRRGKYVAIAYSPDQETLEITLLDKSRRRMDFIALKKNNNYTFTEGTIRIKGRNYIGGNVGGGFEWFDFKLSKNSSDGLLGEDSRRGAALLFYFLPIAGERTDWLLWPRAGQ
ncbi:hypothetical protein JIN85_00315 [Luteolibacter pohnpeiensis]|uniref:Lipoprotein n=1 Tax=Luteolibacter pohnpeiensis TaxID=454153 RepID=A0A934S1X0_9BACT|nr:hypothetical protein [Luteolibacter pohnpeiensis]MBK1880832.1 hypothetical protein [Luteolibacter pohnpeiensis]